MAVHSGDGRRLPCPCRARRAEQHLMAAHRRLLSALAVAGLTALAVLGVSVVLTAIAVLAAGAFAVLLVAARSRRCWSAVADWRTWPPGYDPWDDGGEPVGGQHEGSAYRPGYGFLPGPGRGLLPAGRHV